MNINRSRPGNFRFNIAMMGLDGVAPTEKNIRDGSYPLCRPLHLMTLIVLYIMGVGFGRYLGHRIDPAPLLIGLVLYTAAFVAEVVRAGIQSIEKGQWEASDALGFTGWQKMRYIILPQATQRILPPLAGQFISTIKDSAIVSVISIQELTFQGMELMSATYLTFEIWITITVMYLSLTLTCSLAVERLEIYFRKNSA